MKALEDYNKGVEGAQKQRELESKQRHQELLAVHAKNLKPEQKAQYERLLEQIQERQWWQFEPVALTAALAPKRVPEIRVIDALEPELKRCFGPMSDFNFESLKQQLVQIGPLQGNPDGLEMYQPGFVVAERIQPTTREKFGLYLLVMCGSKEDFLRLMRGLNDFLDNKPLSEETKSLLSESPFTKRMYSMSQNKK